MTNSQHRASFPTSLSSPPLEVVRFPRCETCCRCRTKTCLITCGTICPRCSHDFCPNCIIDTVEDYASKRRLTTSVLRVSPFRSIQAVIDGLMYSCNGAGDSGRPVIVHPTGPSHNCQFLLRYESERRQKFEEQEARTARRIRQARADLSPFSVMNGVREVFDTDSSAYHPS